MPHGNFLRGPIPEHPAPASRQARIPMYRRAAPW